MGKGFSFLFSSLLFSINLVLRNSGPLLRGCPFIMLKSSVFKGRQYIPSGESEGHWSVLPYLENIREAWIDRKDYRQAPFVWSLSTLVGAFCFLVETLYALCWINISSNGWFLEETSSPFLCHSMELKKEIVVVNSAIWILYLTSVCSIAIWVI